MARGSAYSRGVGAIRRLRNAVAEALPLLRELEELENLPDQVGRYVLQPDEDINQEDGVLAFLQLARSLSPGATVEIVAVARQEGKSNAETRQTKEQNSGTEGRAAA